MIIKYFLGSDYADNMGGGPSQGKFFIIRTVCLILEKYNETITKNLLCMTYANK